MVKMQRLKTIAIMLAACAAILVLMTGCAMWKKSSSGNGLLGTAKHDDLSTFIGKITPRNGDPESMYRLAVYYQEKGKHDWAIDEFKKIIAVNSHFAKAYNGIGVSLDHYKKHELAQKAYIKTLQIDSQAGYAWNNLGYSALLQGQPEIAVAYFQKAVMLNSDNKRFQNNLKLAQQHMASDALAHNNKKDNLFVAAVENVHGNSDVATHNNTRILNNEDNIDLDVILDKRGSQHVLTLSPFVSSRLAGFNKIVPANDAIWSEPILTRPTLIKNDQITVKITAPHMPIHSKHAAGIITSKSTVSSVSIIPETMRARYARISALITNVEKFDQEIGYKVGPYIEVSNGNGIAGMAASVKRYLIQKGFSVARANNADSFSIRNTKLYYRDGFLQEAWAVAKTIPGQQNFEKVNSNISENIHIQVVLGKDMKPYIKKFANCS